MNLVRTALLSLAVTTIPAIAQVRGSINGDAPTVNQSITFKGQAKIKVSYTAIAFGEGKWQSILENSDGHERFAGFAAKKPVGTVSLSSPISATRRTIPAGDYDMFFTPFARGERSGWLLNLKNKGDDNAKLIRFPLALKEGDTNNERMTISLLPGASADSANLMIAFGKKSVAVGLSLGEAPAAAEASSKPSKRD